MNTVRKNAKIAKLVAAGIQAFRDGRHLKSNPKKGSDAAHWSEGWHQAQEQARAQTEAHASAVHMKWVRSSRAAQVTGYSVKAIDRKRESGVWLRDIHWTKAPDNTIMINLPAITAWIEGQCQV